ncbi:MAG: hypothetical protein H0T69_10855 [Thermoleophilaceae bacterium]|nr:hypothetical protein [Thermoleophilaceae bacterium]
MEELTPENRHWTAVHPNLGMESRGIRAGLARLVAELDFEHLLLAHGTPLAGDGRERLREFAAYDQGS